MICILWFFPRLLAVLLIKEFPSPIRPRSDPACIHSGGLVPFGRMLCTIVNCRYLKQELTDKETRWHAQSCTESRLFVLDNCCDDRRMCFARGVCHVRRGN